METQKELATIEKEHNLLLLQKQLELFARWIDYTRKTYMQDAKVYKVSKGLSEEHILLKASPVKKIIRDARELGFPPSITRKENIIPNLEELGYKFKKVGTWRGDNKTTFSGFVLVDGEFKMFDEVL